MPTFAKSPKDWMEEDFNTRILATAVELETEYTMLIDMPVTAGRGPHGNRRG